MFSLSPSLWCLTFSVPAVTSFTGLTRCWSDLSCLFGHNEMIHTDSERLFSRLRFTTCWVLLFLCLHEHGRNTWTPRGQKVIYFQLIAYIHICPTVCSETESAPWLLRWLTRCGHEPIITNHRMNATHSPNGYVNNDSLMAFVNISWRFWKYNNIINISTWQLQLRLS